MNADNSVVTRTIYRMERPPTRTVSIRLRKLKTSYINIYNQTVNDTVAHSKI